MSASSVLTQTIQCLSKEFRLEWRSLHRVQATLFLAVLTFILLSTAAADLPSRLKPLLGAATLWLALAISSTLSLTASMRHEMDHKAIESMGWTPLSPLAFFLGKALFSSLFLWVVSLLMGSLCLILFHAPLASGWPALWLTTALGSLAISAPGTLYATLATQTRAGDVLLPLMLFPILLPILLLGISATELCLLGNAMGNLNALWIALFLCNVIFWPLCITLFWVISERA